jgi:predicted amidohydrolase
MRVGYMQYAPAFGRPDINLARVRKFLEGTKADLIVLPELFATGYLFESREELMGMAETDEGPTLTELKKLSLELGTALIGGIPELAGDRCFNTCYLLAGGRVTAKYRKIHLFNREKELFEAGDLGFVVADLHGTKLGLMICFDWIFPEVTRLLALRGAQVICHPSNLVLPYCPQAMITRCIENRVFAITANRVGVEASGETELEFIGYSQVVSPDGKILVRAGDEEVISVIDIDPSLTRDKMVTERNDVLRDRKPELYGEICRPRSEEQ